MVHIISLNFIIFLFNNTHSTGRPSDFFKAFTTRYFTVKTQHSFHYKINHFISVQIYIRILSGTCIQVTCSLSYKYLCFSLPKIELKAKL